MKSKLLGLLFLAAAAIPASATISISSQFGACFDASSAAIPDGTLWALMGDTNGNATFAGGFGINSSLTQAGASQAFTTGQTLSVGTVIGGDTVIAMGAFNGTSQGLTGLAAFVANFTVGVNGVAAGQDLAFYWFPGKTFGANNSVGTQVGGINSMLDETTAAGTAPMVLGADGSATFPGAANGDAGGSIPNARFTAVNLVPESSTALLGALGALSLLRRRRI